MTDLTPVAEGAEVFVNPANGGYDSTAVVAALTGGGYVVAWTANFEDANSNGIVAQRYAADGTPMGAKFVVNSSTSGSQQLPSITALADGGFAIGWVSQHVGMPSFQDIFMQRYDAAGVAQGSETLVNTTTAPLFQYQQALAGLDGGGFVVVWTSQYDNPGDTDGGIFSQRYDSSGVPTGGETLVNSYLAGSQYDPSVTALADGGYVITWSAYNDRPPIYSDIDIFGQRYNAAGVKVGGEFVVNTDRAAREEYSSVTALENGGFVVTWTTRNATPDNQDIAMQVFDANGAKVGGEVIVNSFLTGTQDVSSVTGLADGGFVIAWASRNQIPDDPASAVDVFGQRFDDTGAKIGDEFLINESTLYTQTQSGSSRRQALDQLEDGSLVAVWHNNGYTMVRQFSLPSNTPVNTLPEGTDTLILMNEDTVHHLALADFGFTDADAGDVLFGVTITTLPGAGVLAFNGAAVVAREKFSFSEIESGLLTFTPAANAYGVGYASYTFQVEDQNGGVDPTPNTLTYTVFDVAEPDPYNGVTINGTALKDTISKTKAPAGQPKATALNDKLYGYAGDDSLDGWTGGDRMEGGDGNDKYTIDDANDLVIEAAGALAGTKDLMQSSLVSFTLAANVESGTLLGNLTLGITGNELDNTLTGNTNANSLYGFAGKDKLAGKAGNDHLYGGEGGDTLDGDEGEDTLWGEAGTDTLNGDGDNDVLYGGGDNDKLNGDGGNDLLWGEAGADTLDGGTGIDIRIGGTGADRFDFKVGDVMEGYLELNILLGLGMIGSSSFERIVDFSGKGGEGDRIGLSTIDADGNAANGNSKFTFIGTGAFTGAAQVRYEQFNDVFDPAEGDLADYTLVIADIDGDTVTDLVIWLDGLHTLQAADFLL